MTEWRRLSISPYRSYEVSDDGRVRRDGRELKGNVDRYGYRTVLLSYAGLSKRFKVHRLVCEAWRGPCPDGLECGHLDGNSLNNRADNLAWITQSENNHHRALHGTFTGLENLIPGQHCGESNPNAKLTNAQAAEIRARVRAGEACRPLAREYGTNKSTVSLIGRGNAYAEAGTP